MMSEVRAPLPGDPAPWFYAPASNGNERYDFSSAAGRYVVLGFFASAGQPAAQRALGALLAQREMFDDQRACFFGVSVDRRDRDEQRVAQLLPGIRYLWDFDLVVSRLYGALGEPGGATGGEPYRTFWLVLDPMLRVIAQLPLERVDAVLELVRDLPPLDRHDGIEVHAPVLVLPRVFEPEFCRALIELYRRHGGQESGFMRDEGGRTVRVLDPRHKRRADHVIEDEAVRAATRERIRLRLVPEIHKAYQFTVTRMERYIVCCYDAESGGHFRAHRDNTTKGTAHRRFAVTLNLNAEEYEGGDLRFPEFGPRTYRAPTGGAVVFSCSLLHEALPVTRGQRFVFLPFLYDEAAARIRAENNRYLAEDVGAYRPDVGAYRPDVGAYRPDVGARATTRRG